MYCIVYVKYKDGTIKHQRYVWNSNNSIEPILPQNFNIHQAGSETKEIGTNVLSHSIFLPNCKYWKNILCESEAIDPKNAMVYSLYI